MDKTEWACERMTKDSVATIAEHKGSAKMLRKRDDKERGVREPIATRTCA